MASLVVLLAPTGPVSVVREVLTDLSAVGLVEPFVWVAADAVEHSPIVALSVSGGRSSGTTLQAIAMGAGVDRVRLVVLVPVVEGATQIKSRLEQKVAELLGNTMGGVPLTRIRAIITRAGDTTTTPHLGRVGWHNVLLAPEQASGPGLGHSLLQTTTDSFDIGTQAATAVAGVAGLWAGVAGSPLDSETVDPGESVRLARSFFRRLQSSALETQLRRRVTATSESLPLPVEGGSTSVYVDDNSLATSTMAKALWARHQDVLRGPRDTPPRNAATAIGFWGALKMFFGFLWASVKGAPGRWVDGVLTKVKSGVAERVHAAVFGDSPSAYAVVVGGVTANGLPASWLDLADAADALEDVLEDAGEAREHHAVSDHSALWKDFCAGAFTLADGGDRVPGLSPVQIGTQRAVLRTVDLVVPTPSSRFTTLPGHIAARIEVEGVDAFDVLAINNLHQRLLHLQSEPALGLEVGGALEELGVWNTAHRGSYAGRVGSVLGEAVVNTGAEIKELIERLRAAGAAEDLASNTTSRQKRLSRTLRVLGVIAIVLGIAVGAALGLGYLEATLAIILGVGMLVAWFVASIVTFMRGQRDLFRLITSRTELIANTEVMKRNLRQAVRDLRRLTDAYSQYLTWSRLLGAMLAAPLGRAPEAHEDGARLSPGLPLSVRLGSAAVNDEALANAVVALRRDIFRTGWLTEPWEALIASAPATIGAEGYELKDDPTRIFSQPGTGDTSLLVKWVSIVAEKGVDSKVADRLWGSVQAQLDGDKKELSDALLGSIVELGQPGTTRVPYDTFMARVDSPDLVGATGQFDGAVFTLESRAAAPSGVDRSWGLQQRVGLSRIAVLTQLSQGAPPYIFVANAVEDIGPTVVDNGLTF
ncbi:hypothetical protein GCM10007382_19640 [Salinibacterium xinjiangense]|uniref:Uncharacterized protein n=1 Tax=Salinibacterium xinjiangense TaxID=386302 RepID=A0A2C8YT96_9MICO|nr:hypothetical protein [Salinibacterium xinjiangense]GGK99773.1 hypothetical protein GCM10007382_19640 [Salinibacterium xinjiangense]SOE53853.1 hypothetical protein SAMN06296378_0619 [Salinibacterium xinjiangense]